MEEKFFKVKNLKTGYIYSLKKSDCDRLVTEEPDNFEVIDKNYKKTFIKEKEQSVYEIIVEEKSKENEKSNTSNKPNEEKSKENEKLENLIEKNNNDN